MLAAASVSCWKSRCNVWQLCSEASFRTSRYPTITRMTGVQPWFQTLWSHTVMWRWVMWLCYYLSWEKCNSFSPLRLQPHNNFTRPPDDFTSLEFVKHAKKARKPGAFCHKASVLKALVLDVLRLPGNSTSSKLQISENVSPFNPVTCGKSIRLSRAAPSRIACTRKWKRNGHSNTAPASLRNWWNLIGFWLQKPQIAN